MKRPSHATVVAYLALLVALSGSAYAALGKGSVGTRELKSNAVTSGKIKNGQVKTKDVANGSITATKIKNGKRTYIARVKGSGALVDGDALTASRPSEGQYFLTFADDVSRCAGSAGSAAFDGFDGSLNAVFAQVGVGYEQGGGQNEHSVSVSLYDNSIVNVDSSFTLTLSCPA